MSTTGAINYCTLHFKYKDLTPIRGEPNADSLLRLRNEIKANARSILSHLGGGAHIHLGLVLSPLEYATIANTQPFIQPGHLGTLTIPPGTPQHRAITLKEEYNEELRRFRECQGVEQAFLQQLITAIEPQYLLALRNCQTNSITVPLNKVLNYLTTTFGRVTPQMLDEWMTAVSQMGYNPHQPINLVFNAVDNLCDYADLAFIPFTKLQTVNKAYNILLRSGHFKEALREWRQRPPAAQTWTDFKIFFCRAHQELCEVTDIEMEEAQQQAQQANLVEQVVQGIQNMIQTNKPTTTNEQPTLDHMPPMEPPPVCPQALPTNNMAFTATSMHPQFLQQFQAMQQMQFEQMQKMMEQMTNMNTNTNNNGKKKRTTNKYCWTHGACAHLSKDCRSKADGHQDDATFQDRMGGSTRWMQRT